MVKAFSTLGAPVRFFRRQDALFGEGIVRESLHWSDGDGNGDGTVLLLLWLWCLRLLLLLLFILHVNSLMPCKGRGVIESFTTVGAGVALSL